MTQNKSYLLKAILVSIVVIIVFYALNIFVSEEKKKVVESSFAAQIKLLQDSDITSQDIYKNSRIIKLVYSGKDLIESPDNYPSNYFFDFSKYKEGKINYDNLSPFLFKIYIENNHEIIYMFRVNTNDLKIGNFFYISGITTILLLVYIVTTVFNFYKYNKAYYKKIASVSNIYLEGTNYEENVDLIIEDIKYQKYLIKLHEEVLCLNKDLVFVANKDKILFTNDSNELFSTRHGFDVNIENEIIKDVMSKCINNDFSSGTLDVESGNYYYTSFTKKVFDNKFYIVMLEDVTDKVNYKNNQINFFNQASHELKTPLTAIQGLIEVLLICDLSAEKKEHMLDLSFKECKKLDILISSIIDISKQFKEDDTYSKVYFSSLVDECILNNSTSRTVVITKDIDKQAAIICNKTKVGVIVGNLIKNAFVHNITSGFINIDVTTRLGLVELKIVNSCNSLSEEDFNNILTPFYRNQNAIDFYPNGSGIGLNLVESLCDSYKYKLDFDYQDKIFEVRVTFYSDDLKSKLEI